MTGNVLSFDDFARRFRGARPDQGNQDRWLAFCPLHNGGNEKHRSLRLWRSPRDVYCHRCYTCGDELQTRKSILKLVGLSLRVCYPEGREGGKSVFFKPVARQITHVFDYADEDGVVLYRVIRYRPKSFDQWQPDETANGDRPAGDPRHHFRLGIDGVRRVLYRLPDLIKASKGAWIFLVEGERKADWLWNNGLAGTCNVGGSGMSWSDDYSKSLSGRKVVVLPDNDDSGSRHADRAAGSLLRHGVAELRFLSLPGLPEKGDVLDWTKNGGTPDDLLELAAAATPYSPRRPE